MVQKKFVIGLEEGQCLVGCKGAWKLLQGFERAIAMTRAMKRDGESPGKMAKWRMVVKNILLVVEKIDADNWGYRSMDLREDAVRQGVQEGCTAIQKAEMIYSEAMQYEKKGGNGKATSVKMFDEFKSRVNLAPGQDEWSLGLIDSAMTIGKRLLGVKECRAGLYAIDDAYHDPVSSNFLNSIAKLQVVISKTRTSAALSSFLKNALFCLDKGDLKLEDFAKQKLKETPIPFCWV
jgi:hypothetical protein